MNVGGTVEIDLASLPRWDDTGEARRRLAALAQTPRGARAIVRVGGYMPGIFDLGGYEWRHVGSIEVIGPDPRTVRAWVTALRGDVPDPVLEYDRSIGVEA